MATSREARRYRAALCFELPHRAVSQVNAGLVYLQGSQVRPPGQSSSVRTSHSSGEHTHERALATASDSTTMPPKRSNGALILPSSLSTAVLSAVILCPLLSLLCLSSRSYQYPLSRTITSQTRRGCPSRSRMSFTLRDV